MRPRRQNHWDAIDQARAGHRRLPRRLQGPGHGVPWNLAPFQQSQVDHLDPAAACGSIGEEMPKLWDFERHRQGREWCAGLTRYCHAATEHPAAVEIKPGETIAADFFSDLVWLGQQDLGSNRPPIDPILVYGGDERQERTRATVIPWFRVGDVEW